jgi:hypothetical protein
MLGRIHAHREEPGLARYADRLLADGERVVLRSRQHLLATVVEGRVPWAIFVAALLFVWLTLQQQEGLLRSLFSWVGLGLLVVGLAWLGMIYAQWYAEDYVVTNRRVMKVEGVLRKRSADSSLEKINDAVLEQSVLGRMLGYGSLEILTAAEEAVDRYTFLSEAQTFKKTMLDQKYNLEQEAFQIPAPPLRAAPSMPAGADAAPAAAAATVASPTPAAAARPAMSADDITKAVGDLADLRDRGAITPEEYEAKKAELLGRL